MIQKLADYLFADSWKKFYESYAYAAKTFGVKE